MITVHWVKSTNDTWLPFETVNLAGVTTAGVYIIWHAGNPGRVVRVGQGNIADRIKAHRCDASVTKFSKNGVLRVTWAFVPSHQMNGVERYLANHWKPLVGDAWPDVVPLVVNSPW